jgi:hypothetical protein
MGAELSAELGANLLEAVNNNSLEDVQGLLLERLIRVMHNSAMRCEQQRKERQIKHTE